MDTATRGALALLICGLGGCATVQAVGVQSGPSVLPPGESLVATATRVLPASADSVLVELAVIDGGGGRDLDGTVFACFQSDLTLEEQRVLARALGLPEIEQSTEQIRETVYPFVQRETPRGRRVLQVRVSRNLLADLPEQRLVLGVNPPGEDSVDECPTSRAREVVTFSVQEETQGAHMVLGVGIVVLAVAAIGSLAVLW